MEQIELVIRIPKDVYEDCKQGLDLYGVVDLIKNGQILPKGHGRLIDADAFLKAERPRGISEELWTMCGIYNRIGAMPTIVEKDKEGAEE